MPTDKNGKFTRITAAQSTNHSGDNVKKSGNMPMSKSANSDNAKEQTATVAPGKPVHTKSMGGMERRGSSTTEGNPSYSPISSANTKSK